MLYNKVYSIFFIFLLIKFSLINTYYITFATEKLKEF